VIAVMDTLKMLGKSLFRFFQVELDVSFFSYIPDIVVVYHSVLGVVSQEKIETMKRVLTMMKMIVHTTYRRSASTR
jgi:hypothetical protein